MNLMNLIETIKSDYARFPLDQTYSIYAPNIYFQDPLNKFNGIQKYQDMIGFLGKWFRHLRLELHEIKQVENNSLGNFAGNFANNSPSNFVDSSQDNSQDNFSDNSQNKIITRWTMSWQSPLPWQPKIAVSGWSELEVNPDGLISSHVDYWDCSIWDVLIQHVS